jgi:hypothetical protein
VRRHEIAGDWLTQFYNAFFVDSLQQFAAGLAWDGERPLKFKGETN